MAMTSTALPISTDRIGTQFGGFEILVSRLAVSMLHWSERRYERQRALLEQRVLLQHIERGSARHDVTSATAHIRLMRLS